MFTTLSGLVPLWKVKRLIVFCGILYFAEFTTESVFDGIISWDTVKCGKKMTVLYGIIQV